ncbi:MAG: ASKHA domain-containing protein [Bacteroidota bacterium]
METVKIRLLPQGKVVRARRGSPLRDVLHQYGVEFPCGGKGTCGKCAVRILDGEVDKDPYHTRRLQELKLGPEWRLSCLSRCDSDLLVEVGQYETIIQADETPFEFEPGRGYGVAVDLGTTTLVAQLIDLETGHILAVETGINPQAKFGSDLISRLEAALAHGSEELTSLIRNRIWQMIGALCAGRTNSLEKVVIMGNTVMQHFFCASDIRPLSFYPFESPDLGMKSFTSGELGWSISCNEISFYPSIGSFVGSDILAGIVATGMHDRESYSVLIDLGTNGEIVIGNRDKLLCASTAAGPAFEGARISMGMLATTGAIASVNTLKNGKGCRVIGDAEPRGICGSGLIDAVAVLLKEGFLGEFGEILSNEQNVMIAPPVSISQKDIQEFQLAKAALAAGLKILLREHNIEIGDIKDVYIAGGFGTYLNIENVIRTGMLLCPAEKMHKLGNSSLTGAKMLLFSDPQLTDNILDKTSHVNLEGDPGFQDIFIENMGFYDPDIQ